KIAALAIVAYALLIGISSVGGTVSYFSDVETSIGNYLRADPLYFSVAPATTTIEVGGEDALFVPVMTPGEESEPVQYYVASQMTGGDGALCSALSVLTTAPFPYDGPLLGLLTATTTEVGPWALTFGVAPDSLAVPGASCTADLIYTGWNADAAPGSGYSDVQKVSLTFVFTPPAEIPPADIPPADIPPAEAPQETIMEPPVSEPASVENPPPAEVSAPEVVPEPAPELTPEPTPESPQ
ncbi:MAG: hypothetical protein Q7R71_02045, partial [bacterium]|nr:hypothetical protein [bacterium]